VVSSLRPFFRPARLASSLFEKAPDGRLFRLFCLFLYAAWQAPGISGAGLLFFESAQFFVPLLLTE